VRPDSRHPGDSGQCEEQADFEENRTLRPSLCGLVALFANATSSTRQSQAPLLVLACPASSPLAAACSHGGGGGSGA
jgi:hypothetical protein